MCVCDMLETTTCIRLFSDMTIFFFLHFRRSHQLHFNVLANKTTTEPIESSQFECIDALVFIWLLFERYEREQNKNNNGRKVNTRMHTINVEWMHKPLE